VKARTVLVLWVVLGAALWNGIFDLYITRGAHEYLQRQAEFQLHRGPEPTMDGVMARAKHDGAETATLWAVLIVGAGWTTVLGRKRIGT
jgi:hypothetical protein